MLEPGSTYNIHRIFHSKVYFTLKVTHLGVNLFLLKEDVEGELEALVVEAKYWLVQWF